MYVGYVCTTSTGKKNKNEKKSARAAESMQEVLEQQNEEAEVKINNGRRFIGRLGLLGTIMPEGVNVVGETDAWQKLEIAVDSGASETVVGENMLPNIRIQEGEMFKRGVKYEAANGELIDNLGEKQFEAHSGEGTVRGLTAQACGVNTSLLSVSKMVKAGHRVVF